MIGRQVVVSSRGNYNINEVARGLEELGWHVVPIFTTGNVKEEDKDILVHVEEGVFHTKAHNGDFLQMMQLNNVLIGIAKETRIDRDNVVFVPDALRTTYEEDLMRRGVMNVTTMFLDSSILDADIIIDGGSTIEKRSRQGMSYDYILSDTPRNIVKFINNLVK